jgi:hypothetical protein
MKPGALIDWAYGWLGVPFKHQGRSRFGVDCIGFPIAVLRELELLPAGFSDVRDYGRQPDGLMQPIVERYCRNLAVPVLGCLVLIRWPRGAQAGHAAFCAGGSLIHSYQRAGGVVEHGFRGVWRAKLHSAWALPGIDYV